MAIQNRRGEYADFDPNKAVAGEFLIVQEDDPNTEDGTAAYIAFESGKVKRLSTQEDIATDLEAAVEEAVAEATEEAEASATLAESYAKGGTNTRTGEDTDNALYYKGQAATSASSASGSATSAGTSALASEGYAKGSQNGTDVSSGSPYYENNSKYFKEQAGASALVSEGYAKGSQNGTDVASGSPYYQANAKYYKEQAESSASGASSSASSASTNALKAEGYAVGKQNGTDVTSGSDYYENNAKYYAGEASDSATSAAASAAAAAQSAAAVDFASIAPQFSASTAYSAGDHVYYNDVLYLFTADHAAGAWTGTDVEAVVVGDEITDLKGAIEDSQPHLQTVTLTADSWTNYTQTATVAGVDSDVSTQLIHITPAAASKDEFLECGIVAISQASNSLTFQCAHVPTNNLTVYVTLMEVVSDA